MKKIFEVRKGFTLVELLLAVIILGFTLAGLIQVFIQCSVLAELSKNKTIAVSVAQNKLEEIRNTAYTSIVRIHTSSCPCTDSSDNDSDGLTDYPADAGCSLRVRTGECSDGIDNDGDGLIDFPEDIDDPVGSGCSSAADGDEGGFLSEDTREDYECDDDVDNDGNGLVDFPADSGCSSATDDNEGYLPSIAYGACMGTFTVTELPSASGVISIDAGNSDIMEVQVVVSWVNRGGRSSSVTVKSLMSER